MAIRGQGLSPKTHRVLRAELAGLCAVLMAHSQTLAAAYGKQSRPGRLARRAAQAVEALRVELGVKLVRDRAGWPDDGCPAPDGPPATGLTAAAAAADSQYLPPSPEHRTL